MQKLRDTSAQHIKRKGDGRHLCTLMHNLCISETLMHKCEGRHSCISVKGDTYAEHIKWKGDGRHFCISVAIVQEEWRNFCIETLMHSMSED